ncbi:S-adenosyl-L-methionine-dependent methyltransferase [Endogone sp. FLAS-F59071]|nr:S-adenosyl-L-methionine-dependent methyltransferase [Endogone sp. FLAS-F59071]|eukprot:RUS17439.1 S-adenosyl-L-methionine-dependent methyltransferase [Endogone sp. FLAS-F59071]
MSRPVPIIPINVYTEPEVDLCRDWDKLWVSSTTPWDHGGVSPALVQLVEERGYPLPQEGRVLVPGCGRGYDVFYLANEKRHVCGLDISPTAIEEVKKIQHSRNFPESFANFICDDFFKFPVPNGLYDLVYDYTFFCALPSTMRSDWASRMAEIIRPGGSLICLIFPISEHEGGPPFSVTVEIYRKLLTPFFEELLLDDCKSHSSRQGKEKISVWERRA